MFDGWSVGLLFAFAVGFLLGGLIAGLRLRAVRRVLWRWRDALPGLADTHRRSEADRLDGLLRAVATRQERERAVLLAAADAVFTCTAESEIVAANPAASRMFGYEPSELIGRRITDLVPLNDSEERHLQTASTSSVRLFGAKRELDGRRKNGSTVPIDVAVSRCRIGDEVLMVVIVHDRTESRQAERDRKLQALTFAGISDGVVVANLDGRILDLNPAAEKMFGYARDEVIGLHVGMLHGAAPPASVNEAALEKMHRPGRWRGEFRLQRRDGSEVICETTIAPLADEHGERIATVRLHRDVTETRKAEERLRLLQSVVVHMADAVLILKADPAGEPARVIYTNEAFARQTGYATLEAGDRPAWELLGAFDDETALMRDAARRWQPSRADIPCRRKDGSAYWADVSLTPVTGEAGWPVHWLCVFRDTTERHQAEAELRRAKEAAEAGNRAKGEFLANVSHELRTPLNAIVGLTALMLEDPNTDAKERLGQVKASSEILLTLVDDLLDLSRVEAGRLELRESPFSPRDLMRTAIEPLTPRATARGLTFSIAVENTVPEGLIGDVGRLRQVLVNLTDNAIKFTDRGSVEVRASGQPEADGWFQLVLSVRDTGVGIPDEKQTAIFLPFEQADGSASRRHGGVGLGLAIVARLAGLMGGRVSVESQVGVGSTFTFAVPLVVAGDVLPPEGTRISPPARFSGRVLLAEDNPVNQAIARAMLEGRGVAVVVTADGQAALEALAANSFDLVLMDVQMPGMDGLEATRRLRVAEAGTGRRQLVVALTAHAMAGDREKCLAAGMDDYLTKPLLPATLDEILLRYLRPAYDRSAALARLGGDAGLLRDVESIVLEKASAFLADLEAASELPAIERTAHRVRGAISYLSREAADTARRAELAAREGREAEARHELARLRDQLAGLVGSLRPDAQRA